MRAVLKLFMSDPDCASEFNLFVQGLPPNKMLQIHELLDAQKN